MAKKQEEPIVEYSSGNVFADLGFEDAEEMLAKAKLAIAIKDVIKSRGLNQTEAAERMGIDQPKVSKIMRGRLSEFSTNRMLNYLIRLGLRVDVTIHMETPPVEGSGSMNIAYYM